MSKYFNTEILRTLAAQAPVDDMDPSNDRFAAMDPAGQYLLYVSSDPQKALNPRNVKKTLRHLFREKDKPHGCVVKIREEKVQEEELRDNEQKSLAKEVPKIAHTERTDHPVRQGVRIRCSHNCRKSWRAVAVGFPEDDFMEDTDEPTSTVTANKEERATGGHNITYDPKLFMEESRSSCLDKSKTYVRLLHWNPKPIKSSCTNQDFKRFPSRKTFASKDDCIEASDDNTEMLEKQEEHQEEPLGEHQGEPQVELQVDYQERQVEHDKHQKTSQVKPIEESQPEEEKPLSEIDHLKRLDQQLVLFSRLVKNQDNLMQYLEELGKLRQLRDNKNRSYCNYSWISEDSDDADVDWLSRNPFTSAHGIPKPCVQEVKKDSPNSVEQFRCALRCFLRSIVQFFSTDQEEPPLSGGPYVDPDKFAPLILGPTIDEPMVLLLDRLMLAIKWIMKTEEELILDNQAEQVREEGGMVVKMPPETSALKTETEQQPRKVPSSSRMINPLESEKSGTARPMYLITQSKGRRW
ncbi:uncharacterized protein LOC108049851 [Drosophila rhopaloa]|uniref:Uncharacterized protein LOC108049851 n=1 Tax=Drosophila rhopaloa TaxID=1041015 RepID=A0A6P4F8C9_DRORH|nr:uncharacterized protein LOC108049851 [Drosophila rhopaloa]